MKSIREDSEVADDGLERRLARADAAAEAVVEGFSNSNALTVREYHRETCVPYPGEPDLKVLFRLSEHDKHALIILTVPVEGEPIVHVRESPPVSLSSFSSGSVVLSYRNRYDQLLQDKGIATNIRDPEGYSPDDLHKMEIRKKEVEAVAPALNDFYATKPRLKKTWFTVDEDPTSELNVLFNVGGALFCIRASLGKHPTLDYLNGGAESGAKPVDEGPLSSYYFKHLNTPSQQLGPSESADTV